MDIDDILDELDDLETDAGLAAAVSIGTRDISTINQDRLPAVCAELARESSGFKCIPGSMLTKELLIVGMQHMNAKEAEIHASDDYTENYQQAALSRLESRALFLMAFHPDLIDKRMVLQMLETSSMGDDRQIAKLRADVVDDEVGLASLKREGMTVFFEHPAAASFSEDTWRQALATHARFIVPMIDHQLTPLLGKILAEGYWPTQMAWQKPADLKDAIGLRAKVKDDTRPEAETYNAFIKMHPIEDVLPLLKSPARAKIRSKIYTIDELRPYMKQFPFLKASVLESDLGM